MTPAPTLTGTDDRAAILDLAMRYVAARAAGSASALIEASDLFEHLDAMAEARRVMETQK